MDSCRDQLIYAFPVLSGNELALFISECINEKIKVTDFSIASRLDYILSRILSFYHGVRVNPEKPSVFIKFVLGFFQKIGCNVQPFDAFDFLPERDGKKWIRILSHLVQFNRNMQTMYDLFKQFHDEAKFKKQDAKEIKQQVSKLREDCKLQQAKQIEYQQKISDLNSKYSGVSEALIKIKQSLQSSNQQLSSFLNSEKKDALEIDSLKKEVASLTTHNEELIIRQIDNPEQLPELVETLQQQINECELRVSDLYHRGSLVEQSVENFRRLENQIQQELVIGVEACQLRFEKLHKSQSSLEIMKRETLIVKEEAMAKALTEYETISEQVRLAENAHFRQKILVAKNKVDDDGVRKEKSELLDSLCAKSESLLQTTTRYDELVKTSKIICEEQHDDTERTQNLKQIQDITNSLQTLFESYVQHSAQAVEQ